MARFVPATMGVRAGPAPLIKISLGIRDGVPF
jgi:hypothetical protein